MIHFSLILHINSGMKYVEKPFNMGMVHTSGHSYSGVAPLGEVVRVGNEAQDNALMTIDL